MKALVFNDVGNIALKEVSDPRIEQETDVIVKITTTTICGTDLHSVRGTIPNMKKGTILGHEGIGVVEQIGTQVQKFNVGDRVIVPSTIACGDCDYCEKKLYALCDNANPQGPDAGSPYYGGPKDSGPFQGMQAEKVRVPFADVNLVKIPHGMEDDQVILLSDILPTAYMGVEMADVHPADIVAVFGCGPVGQLVIACLKHLHVKHIIAIDRVPSRLSMAQKQGAHVINFDEQDPVQALKKLTNNKGPNKIIDAVGIDADHPTYGFIGYFTHFSENREFKQEVKKVAPRAKPDRGNWVPGNGPSQVFRWAVKAIAKGGTFSIIGVYTELLTTFPMGEAMGKNLIIRMGNCNHRAYIPLLLNWIKDESFNPNFFITQKLPFSEIVEAYKHFDKRDENWIKVSLSVR